MTNGTLVKKHVPATKQLAELSRKLFQKSPLPIFEKLDVHDYSHFRLVRRIKKRGNELKASPLQGSSYKNFSFHVSLFSLICSDSSFLFSVCTLFFLILIFDYYKYFTEILVVVLHYFNLWFIDFFLSKLVNSNEDRLLMF